jgi:hypothetical protein
MGGTSRMPSNPTATFRFCNARAKTSRFPSAIGLA